VIVGWHFPVVPEPENLGFVRIWGNQSLFKIAWLCYSVAALVAYRRKHHYEASCMCAYCLSRIVR